jgi:hypothetical protein
VGNESGGQGLARRRQLVSHAALLLRDINVSSYAGVLNMDFRRNGDT